MFVLQPLLAVPRRRSHCDEAEGVVDVAVHVWPSVVATETGSIPALPTTTQLFCAGQETPAISSEAGWGRLRRPRRPSVRRGRECGRLTTGVIEAASKALRSCSAGHLVDSGSAGRQSLGLPGTPPSVVSTAIPDTVGSLSPAMLAPTAVHCVAVLHETERSEPLPMPFDALRSVQVTPPSFHTTMESPTATQKVAVAQVTAATERTPEGRSPWVQVAPPSAEVIS